MAPPDAGGGRSTPTFRLEPRTYLDPAFLAQEQAEVFGRAWSLVADATELAEVGDTLPVVVGTNPIVVARTEHGLRAHHNICRHRGMQVVLDPARCSALRCSYHGWEWDLDGDLTRVPQRRTQFPDLVDAELGLLPASVEEWEGMVFVHPDPAPGPLADALGVVRDGIGSFRPGRLDQVAHVPLMARCNWKLFVENHIDVYHLWYLHDRSLADYDHTRFEHAGASGNWTSYEPVKAARRDRIEPIVGARAISHLDERDRAGIGAHMVFPNLLMASTAEFFITYQVTPVTPDESRIDLRVRAEPGSDPAGLVAAARSFIDEDIVACERIQAAMRSDRFVVGPLALDHEQPIEDFQRHLLGRFGATDALDGAH